MHAFHIRLHVGDHRGDRDWGHRDDWGYGDGWGYRGGWDGDDRDRCSWGYGDR
jgi:hypothetical protein